MLENNFKIDFCPKARVSLDSSSSDEVFEVDENLYVHKFIALTGRNSSGKSTTLQAISKVIYFMNTGRWLYDPHDFRGNRINLNIEFYKDGYIYVHESEIYATSNNIYGGMMNPFCTIKDISFERAKYRSDVGRNYMKYLNFRKVIIDSLSLSDTSEIAFVTGNKIYGYNLPIYSSSGTLVNNSFFDCLNELDFDLTCSIIRLLDESIEYIKCNNKGIISFKRFDEKEKRMNKLELLNHLSNGTIKGIELYINTIKLLKTGGILLVDEIENCFHKNLVNNIIYLLEDRTLNKHNAMLIFTTHYVEILDTLSRRDNIFVLHKKDRRITISNVYGNYEVRSEILKSKQFNNNTFDTLLNYETLMEVRRGIKNEIHGNDGRNL